MRRAKRWHPSEESDELIFAVCQRFLSQLGAQFDASANELEPERRGPASAVAEWLRDHWGRVDLTREKIYPLFWEAARRKFLFLQSPREQRLAQSLSQAFGIECCDIDSPPIEVVNVRGREATEHVTAAGADLVLSLIYKLGRKKNAGKPKGAPPEAVHVGMGAGYATMLLARRLASRVYSDVNCPPLVLHALSAGGFLVSEPQKAPSTYFSYFEGALPRVEYVALFSETVVNNEDDYVRLKENPGVRLSFQRRHEIDIVLTSLADANHEHGLLVRFLSHLVDEGLVTQESLDQMRALGWKGDVQFRPYTAQGPLVEHCPVRAVTLFELSELVELGRKADKYVVLVAGPCGECGASKRDALLPLLTEPSLRLWTHLVTDVQTARDLLEA